MSDTTPPLPLPADAAGRRLPWLGLVAAVTVAAYLRVLDNYFAGDDYSWLFQAAKTIHRPLAFFAPMNGFLRSTELAYFLAPTLVWGFHPLPFFALLVAIHAANAVLVGELIWRVAGTRTAALAGALFWALSYKHAEVVMRPYAVADSVALVFGLASMLLALRGRHALATLALVAALFGKENAVVFPLLTALAGAGLGRRWLLATAPQWVVTATFVLLSAVTRASAASYLHLDLSLFSRFWESLLSLLGPDATWLKQVVLDGAATLLPPWLAALALVPLTALAWRLPRSWRFALLWTAVTLLPTVAVLHQSSRYFYLPLVGVALAFGLGIDATMVHLARPGRRAGLVVLAALLTVLAAFCLVGIANEDADYERLGEVHRLAAASFANDVAPALRASAPGVVLFARSPSLELAERLYRPRRWYEPETFKWIYRRSYGILGLTNTWGFVTSCTYDAAAPELFVAASRAELDAALAADDFALVVHDSDSGRFALADHRLRAEARESAHATDLYAVLQPGRFDPSFAGDQVQESPAPSER